MLAVYLRNCSHARYNSGTGVGQINDTTSTTYQRYALQADSVSIQIQKSPTHLAVPKTIKIIDLNTAKPVITITGTVDNVGGDTSITTTGFENMSKVQVSRKYWAYDGSGNANSDFSYTSKTQDYYVPYKNKLEEIVYEFQGKMSDPDSSIELEIADATYPVYNRGAEYINSSVVASPTNTPGVTDDETGGAIYAVAINNARFDMEAGREDRWTFQIQFIAEYRKDFKF